MFRFMPPFSATTIRKYGNLLPSEEGKRSGRINYFTSVQVSVQVRPIASTSVFAIIF